MRFRIQNPVWSLLCLLSACPLALGAEHIVDFRSAPATKKANEVGLHGASNGSPDTTGSMLYLNDDDYFSGDLRDCPPANTIRWQARGTTQPFEFHADAIRSAFFPPPQKRPAPVGEYCFELSDGDILYGSLAAITKDDLEINSTQFGHL